MGTSANQLPSIVERFERVCDTYPQRPALVTETQSLDYRSLNSAANAVAHQIAAQIDAGPRRIAVLLSEELSALITILGILKAGHTYVPLDRDYPHERTRYMLDNCGAALLLVDANTREQANALDCPCAQLTIEQNRNPRGANPGKTINPNSPAYVLYTSGSTGAPKGIVQTHRNLAHHVDNFSRPLSIGPQDRLAVFASLCFAASLMDVYGALLSGAALYPHYLKHHDLTTLAEWLSQHEISVFHSTPTVFRQLCQTLSAEHQLRTVRVIDLAGEPLYWSDVTLYKRHFDSSCNLVNRLALTEVQTVAQYRVTHETEAEGTLVPVGEPAPGIELFIQDDAGAPAATGEVGTIGVRSRYLAPGNCDNPGLESVDPQEPRMLLTGDIGYLDTNRHLFHLGRTDARVKIRGFSIDLAEVEAALQSFDAIAKAAVVVGDSGNGYERLVAYLEPRKPATLTPHAVFEYLRRKLPQYMLPAYLLIEPELPLTPNGKIDKNVLATSIERRPAMSNPLVAPRNHTEEQLLVLWERTLGLTGIGVSDEFWSLGGDSLVAADLLTEIERALEQRLPLSSITLFTTIEQLAGEIAAGVSHQTGPVLTIVLSS